MTHPYPLPDIREGSPDGIGMGGLINFTIFKLFFIYL
jgi:hypothetical protein